MYHRLDIDDTFHQTDKALDTLREWRDIEGHKIFASKLRFQIRLDDFRWVLLSIFSRFCCENKYLNCIERDEFNSFFMLRCSYDSKFCDGDQPLIHQYNSSQSLALHEIQGFYNLVTSTLLDQLSKEIQNTNGTKSWR